MLLKRKIDFGSMLLACGLLSQVIVYIFTKDSFLSFVSGIAGMVSVIQCSEKRLNFYFWSFLQMITYTIICFQENLHGKLVENGFYFITMVIGLFVWWKNLDNEKYGISNFFDLSEEPEVEYFWNRGNASIPIYKIHTIAGTCIAKDKTKSCITLLTTEGVVNVKFRKEYFSIMDRQISQYDENLGRKKVIEKSRFTRGNLLIIKGIRRGDDFIVKKYSNTPGHQLYLITKVEDDGSIEIKHERAGE